MTNDADLEQRVEQLVRRSDGPALIRPLDASLVSRSRASRTLAATSFILAVVVAGVLAVGVINARRQPVAASPAPTAVSTQASSPTARPPASFGADFATADEVAAAVQQALERPDPQLLLRTLAPSGWYARWYQQTQTSPMSRTEAWSWLLNSTAATWHIDMATMHDADASMPPGDKFVSALAINFNAWPEQRAAIMLQSIGGRWYWSGLLLFRPPPIFSALPGDVAGYATVLNITDSTLSVRFRTVGSRCCADPSWNGRSAVLRRDASSKYTGPGGTPATSLADTDATLGSDVWVRFSIDSMLADGSYRLADLEKMYP